MRGSQGKLCEDRGGSCARIAREAERGSLGKLCADREGSCARISGERVTSVPGSGGGGGDGCSR